MSNDIIYDLTPVHSNIFNGVVYANHYYSVPKKVETKKERIARIATERRLASHKMYNERTLNIIEVVQISKPKYRLIFYNK